MKKILIILLVSILLTSCADKESTTEPQETSKVVKSEDLSKEEKTEAITKKETSTKSETTKKVTETSTTVEESTSESKIDTALQQEYSGKTLDFVSALGDAYSIVFEEFFDYNFDGKMEAVVFVQDMDNITDVYFLGLEGEKAELLSSCNILNLEDDDIYNNIIYDAVGSLKLSGFDYPVPFAYLERGERLNGYKFYHFLDDYMDELWSSVPICDVGISELIDEDGDGYYDKIELNNWGYDVFYYPKKTTFIFEDAWLILDKVSIDLGEYPDNPLDVVKEYMFLSSTKDSDIGYIGENLDERLKELATVEFDHKNVFSYELLQNLVIGIPDGTEIIDEIYEADALIRVKPAPDNPIDKVTLDFVLKKENEKWQIVAIEPVE